jgi:hypothetical protein
LYVIKSKEIGPILSRSLSHFFLNPFFCTYILLFIHLPPSLSLSLSYSTTRLNLTNLIITFILHHPCFYVISISMIESIFSSENAENVCVGVGRSPSLRLKIQLNKSYFYIKVLVIVSSKVQGNWRSWQRVSLAWTRSPVRFRHSPLFLIYYDFFQNK